jgi:cytochrome c-type biogenesis protein CcmF
LLAVATVVVLIALGFRPWQEASYFYSLMTIGLSVLVGATVISEFVRGGRVIAAHTGQNLPASMVQLTRRNTRRYGGYLVHFGVVVIMIGFAGSAFNLDAEKEVGYGDKLNIGRYTLVCRSYTQDENPNYAYESAIVDVFKGGKQITTLYPERRFYKSSGQPNTIVANHSTPREDLYLIYAGQNPDTGRPIIKARVNPLVMWIWVGFFIIAGGTIVALVPNMAAARVLRVVPVKARAEAQVAGSPVGAGD